MVGGVVPEYEEWRYVMNFPEYVISNLGNIRRAGGQMGRPLSLHADENGNVFVMLAADGNERRRLRLDKIVAASFLPPVRGRAMSQEIIHLDGNRSNCRSDNLAWPTKERR